MRGLTTFHEGELVTIDGVDYQFHSLVAPEVARPDGSDDLQFLNARHRRVAIYSPAEFLSAYAAGRVRLHRSNTHPGDGGGEDESPEKALRRRWRHFWVCAFDAEPVPLSSKKLAAFVEEVEADLVVLGARPRGRWEANLLGSTALFATGRLGCDVLLVPGPA